MFPILSDSRQSEKVKLNPRVELHDTLLRKISAEPTSKVISRRFLGIGITPVSPSSPDTQIQGFDVMIALLSFLMGMMTDLYGITERKRLKLIKSYNEILLITKQICVKNSVGFHT